MVSGSSTKRLQKMVRPTTRKPVRLDRRFFRRDAITVARALLGQRLVRIANGKRLSGLIVETEAYLGVKDRAAHSFGGKRTRRTETMFCDGGTAYVFLNYGIHHLLNVVVSIPEDPQAVLLRAIQPDEGVDVMFRNRPRARRDTDLCSGPGKLGAALAIDHSHDRLDLVTSPVLFIERARGCRFVKARITASPRIGVDYAREWARRPLRFHWTGNEHVSRR
jgi:DNA-3-methyladenine glycosylase